MATRVNPGIEVRRPGLWVHVRALLQRGVMALEYLGARWPAFAGWYSRRFYGRIIVREIDLAGLDPGSRVLHVGCGPFPFTALALARWGCTVEAVDSDEAAVRSALRIVRAHDLEGMISVRRADGLDVDCSGFDAVWISMHVWPQEEVIRRCLGSLEPGARMVFREATGLLTTIYGAVCPLRAGLSAHARVTRRPARRTMLTVVGEKLPPTERARVDLGSLGTGQGGVIADTGDAHPLLEPLGIRSGRPIRVSCVERLGGPLIVDADGRRVAIDRQIARRITVIPSGERVAS